MQVAIVGGSFTGLACANVLLRLGAIVTVFEKSATPFFNRGSSLGYLDVQLWEYVRGDGSQMTRRGRRAHRSQGAFYYGDLWRYLYTGLPEGTVKFGSLVSGLGEDAARPTIDGTTYDLAIICDGGWSSLRERYLGISRLPEYSGHMLYRAKLDAKFFPGFSGEGAYMQDRVFAIALNVAHDDPNENYIMGGVGVGAPESEVVRAASGTSRHTEEGPIVEPLPDWFMPYMRKKFARHADGQLLRWLELCLEKGKITPQPLFEFGGINASVCVCVCV